MIRPDELYAIKAGDLDLAFRRWDRARVKVGTRMRTAVGVVEVLSVQRVAPSRITADDARRAGARSIAALRTALAHHEDRPVYRVGLVYAGPDPRSSLRSQVPDAEQTADLVAWLDRLDRSSSVGPWTRATLTIIDRSPAVRAPDLAAALGRPTLEFKRDVRKLKERGLTESLDIGYRLSARGAALADHLGVRAAPGRDGATAIGTSLPRIGAPASRSLGAQGVTTLEQAATWSRSRLLGLHGVGPHAVRVLEHALAERGEVLAAD